MGKEFVEFKKLWFAQFHEKMVSILIPFLSLVSNFWVKMDQFQEKAGILPSVNNRTLFIQMPFSVDLDVNRKNR